MNLASAIASPGVDLVGAAAVVAACLSLLKPFVECRLAPTARLHDPVLRLLAVVLGITIVTVATAAGPGFHAGQDVLNACLGGLGVGLGSVGAFHIIAMSPAVGPAVGTVTSLTPAAAVPAVETPAPAVSPATEPTAAAATA